MGIYIRSDSPFYWMELEGYRNTRGRRLRESTGMLHDASTPELRKSNRESATHVYHTRMTELARGKAGLKTKTAISFRAYADWYRTHIVETRAKPARERSILLALRDWFGTRGLDTIDREAVLEWRTQRLTEVSPATMDRELDLLKRMLAMAVPKYLDASPIVGLRRHRETVHAKKRRPRVLSVEEETRLLAQAKDATERALVILALDTLMRLTDVASLRRDRDHGHQLHVEAPKIDPYDVPLSTRARAALDALPVNGPYFFPRRWKGKEGHLSTNTVWRIFHRLCEDAGVPTGRAVRGVTFHSLRHTGTTRMLEHGINPVAVMEIGGWSELRQLARYGHTTDATKQRGVESIAPSVGDAVTSPPRGTKHRRKS